MIFECQTCKAAGEKYCQTAIAGKALAQYDLTANKTDRVVYEALAALLCVRCGFAGQGNLRAIEWRVVTTGAKKLLPRKDWFQFGPHAPGLLNIQATGEIA